MKSSFGHLQINVNSSNLPFYKELFERLSWSVLYEDENMLGVGDEKWGSLWFAAPMHAVANDYDGPGMNHLGIAVGAQTDVDTIVGYLRERGIPALFETPRHRPEFSAGEGDTYYQVMFESPDRILFEIVYTGPKSL